MKLRQSNATFSQRFEKYGEIYLTSLREILYYPQKLRATLIIVPFRIIVMLIIYTYAFNYIGKSINGINANIAVWSIAIYHILLFTQFRNVFRVINEDVRRGNLDTQLNKPYNYLLYKFWEHLGKCLPNFILSILTVVPLLYILTGGPQASFTPATILGALLLMIGGTLVSAVLYIFISLPTLWVDDATPFFWIVDKAILIFGGAYIPLALLPNSFQTFATLTPFGAPMFATQMFYPNFSATWPSLFVVQLFWTVLLLFVISLVFAKARLKLSVNGG